MRTLTAAALPSLLLVALPFAAWADQQESKPLGDLAELDSRQLAGNPEDWPGAKLYQQHCAMCHAGQVPKAPQKMFLQMLSGPTIDASLTDGLMAAQGATLSPQQRREIAEYLSGAPLDAQRAAAGPPKCEGPAAQFDKSQPPLASGWGYDNARFVAASDAGIDRAGAKSLRLAWAMEFPNAIRARSQPAIAWGAIFVGSADGTVYALDLASGCARWTFKAGAEVRTGIVPFGSAPDDASLAFGDVIGRAYVIDAFTGALRWSHKVDEHPHATLTGTPTYHDGILYVPVSSLEVTSAGDPNYPCCTFRGAVVALDANTGAEKWKAFTIDEPPAVVRKTNLGTAIHAPSGAPIWNSPTIDARRGVLYVGTGENYSSPADDRSDALMAFRLSDGKLVWSQQMVAGDAWNVACMMKDNPNCPLENGPDVDFGAGTILATLANGRQVLLAGQKNGVVYALDPDAKGALLWKTRVGRGGIQGGVHFGMALAGDRVFAPVSDMKDGRDGRPVDSPPRPGLNALDTATGALRWSTPAKDVCGTREFCDAGISAAITATPEVVFAGHMDGRFRAYDAANGAVLFEFDSTQPVKTVSGAMARGGSFGGGGSAVRDGHVVVNSGYGLYFHMPGNVLLVFTSD